MSYPTYNLTYTQWKAARTSIGGTTYYVEHDKRYIALVIKSTLDRVEIYQIDVIKDPTDSNLVDFETNIKGTATKKDTTEDAIAAELA